MVEILNLSDGERAFLEECRAIQTDSRGREVFAGLTREETEEYLLLLAAHRLSSTDSGRLDKLVERHEAVRMQIIAAEAEARQAGPKH